MGPLLCCPSPPRPPGQEVTRRPPVRSQEGTTKPQGSALVMRFLLSVWVWVYRMRSYAHRMP
jgi:hypothetical protein